MHIRRGDGGLTTAEREHLNRLRRENRQCRLEREILSKAVSWSDSAVPQNPGMPEPAGRAGY